MQNFLTTLSDFIFPPTEGEMLLRNTNSSVIASLYRPGTFRNTQYLCQYSEKIIQTAITENKFYHHKLAGELLGEILNTWTEKQTRPIIYLPIPLGPRRLRQRGHNQVETILNTCNTKIIVNKSILKRSKETLPQSHLRKSDRRKNMKDVFMCTSTIRNIPANTHLILVDDVVTTGATLLAAKGTLMKELPISVTVSCLAIAH